MSPFFGLRTLLACPCLLTLTRSLSLARPLGTPLYLYLSRSVSRTDIFLSLSSPCSAVLERFCWCVLTFPFSVTPSFHLLPRACRRLFYLCLVRSCVPGPPIHTACLLLKLVRSWGPLSLPVGGSSLGLASQPLCY